MTLRAAGADTGAHAGIALVREPVEGEGTRLVLEGVWEVFGADHLWLGRAQAACSELWDFAGGDVQLYVENPPKTGRHDSVKGDRRGHTTWRGMGRRKGMVEGVWFCVTQTCAVTFEQADWTSEFGGQLKSKKVDGGKHRIIEATMLISGAGVALKAVRDNCRVDCAEAILIAAAGIRRARRAG